MMLLAVACAGEREPHDVDALDALFSPWNKPGSPGCAIGVAQDGDVIYSKGFGYANLDYDVAITPQTIFDVASITKQFVAASLNLLALEGKLSLDDDVRQWLPELPAYEHPITLRHMIYHTSGLRDYLTLFPLAGRHDYYPISHAQILAMMSRQRAVNFAPGEQYLYSNTAYMLLAQVVERASGQTLGEFADEQIYQPLGMHGSLMYDDFERVIPRRAIGYVRDDTGDVRMVHNYNFDVPGDGQMYTTVGDLLRWDTYLHGENKPAFHASILTPGTLNNGERLERAQGLFLGEYRGLDTIHHTGSSWGFRSVLMRFRDTGLAIAIACNDDNASPYRLALRVADFLLPDELGPKAEDESNRAEAGEEAETDSPLLSAAQLGEYTGKYYSAELDATYRLTVDKQRLMLAIEHEAPSAIVPRGVDWFDFDFLPPGWSDWDSLRVDLHFTRDDAGSISGFRLDAGEVEGIDFERNK